MRLKDTDRKAMFALIEQWQRSGMLQKDFYRQHNITSHVFYYWYKCYRTHHDKTAAPSSPSSNHFIELQPQPAGPQTGIEIRLPGGIQIFCNEQVSVDYLKALIR